jgi:hypothetical protein
VLGAGRHAALSEGVGDQRVAVIVLARDRYQPPVSNPGRRPQPGVRRVRRLPMRSHPRAGLKRRDPAHERLSIEKFVFRSVAHSQCLSNVDLCGVPGVLIVGPLRPHGRRRTRRTPSWFASSDARLRRQPGERVASAARWKRRQHNRGSNLMRVGDQCQATTRDPRGPLGISAGEWGRVGGDYHRQRTLAVWRARELILKIRGE